MKKFTLIAALIAVVGLSSLASAAEFGSVSAKSWGKTVDGKLSISIKAEARPVSE